MRFADVKNQCFRVVMGENKKQTLRSVINFLDGNISRIALICALSQSAQTPYGNIIVILVVTFALKFMLGRFKNSVKNTGWFLCYRLFSKIIYFANYYSVYMLVRKFSDDILNSLQSNMQSGGFFELLVPIFMVNIIETFVVLLEYIVISDDPAYAEKLRSDKRRIRKRTDEEGRTLETIDDGLIAVNSFG